MWWFTRVRNTDLCVLVNPFPAWHNPRHAYILYLGARMGPFVWESVFSYRPNSDHDDGGGCDGLLVQSNTCTRRTTC